MCGIFGFVVNSKSGLDLTDTRKLLIDLFHRSEPRGRDASGVVVITGNSAQIYKRPLPPDKFLSDPLFQDFLNQNLRLAIDSASGLVNLPLAVIGHCRLVLSGSEVVHENNQPIMAGKITGIHNGLITNESEIHNNHPDIGGENGIDSKTIFQLIDKHIEKGLKIPTAIARSFEELEGTAAIAFFREQEGFLTLATNYGSIYISDCKGITFFASERYILENFIEFNQNIIEGYKKVEPIAPDNGVLISLKSAKPTAFNLSRTKDNTLPDEAAFSGKIEDWSPSINELTRCTKCILPATYPFINFGKNGICNYCRDYSSPELFGEQVLEEKFDKFRSKDGSPDCLIGLSGGRDSSYGLHLLKTKYKMNPIAFSYDWGMVTDISRRNQARLCSKLKIEHIFRAADIPFKRRNMRKNIEAWLKRPHLGMVPLFMAGDKFFYNIARELRKETGIPLVVWCAGNDLERTDFKGGFAGIRESKHRNRLYAFPVYHKLKIGMFYATQYLLNPSYINESFFENILSFFATFIAKDDFVYLYEHLPWNEEELVSTLVDEYGWEKATYTENTWRIGDGYTTFINYIYYSIAGFSEFDTFRSQQVRAGLIDRDTALRLASKDNKFDMATLEEFMQQVGLNLEEILTKISKIPKLYSQDR